MRSENRLHAVGVFFAYRFIPAPVRRRRNLAGSIALDEARRLGQLQPENRLSLGTAARVECRRLADANGRHGRQHATLRLVGGLGHAVQTRREMS
jgi:hypothetical protein